MGLNLASTLIVELEILNSFNSDNFNSPRSIFRISTKPEIVTFSKKCMRKNSLRSSEFQRELELDGEY